MRGRSAECDLGSRCREEVPGCARILSVRRPASRPARSLRARNVDSDPTEGLYRAGNGGAGTSMHFAIHGSPPRLDRRRRRRLHAVRIVAATLFAVLAVVALVAP